MLSFSRFGVCTLVISLTACSSFEFPFANIYASKDSISERTEVIKLNNTGERPYQLKFVGRTITNEDAGAFIVGEGFVHGIEPIIKGTPFKLDFESDPKVSAVVTSATGFSSPRLLSPEAQAWQKYCAGDKGLTEAEWDLVLSPDAIMPAALENNCYPPK